MLFKLPEWAYNKAVGRFINKDQVDAEGEDLHAVVDTPSEENAVEAATSINANGEARKRRAKAGRK